MAKPTLPASRAPKPRPAIPASKNATAFEAPALYCNALHSAAQGPILRLTFGESGQSSGGAHWHVAVALHEKVVRALAETLNKFLEEDAADAFPERTDLSDDD